MKKIFSTVFAVSLVLVTFSIVSAGGAKTGNVTQQIESKNEVDVNLVGMGDKNKQDIKNINVGDGSKTGDINQTIKSENEVDVNLVGKGNENEQGIKNIKIGK